MSSQSNRSETVIPTSLREQVFTVDPVTSMLAAPVHVGYPLRRVEKPRPSPLLLLVY
jgi:hypothetical protein